MNRVRLFSDWDDSETLALNVYGRSLSWTSRRFQFNDTLFVWDDDYDYAVVFNFATDQVPNDFPYAKTIGLILEPKEILDVMYQGWRGFDPSRYAAYYSFTPLEGFQPALGIGLPQGSPFPEPPGWKDRELACMIASNKTYTPYQAHRRKVMAELMSRDVDIHFYGRGMPEGDDPRVRGEIPQGEKDAVLDRYKYVIDFENSPYALTDKFFDPALRGCVPITNSLALEELGLNQGCHWVKFDKKPADIANTVTWFLKPLMGKEPSKELRYEVANGRLCLANWINEKVSELP